MKIFLQFLERTSRSVLISTNLLALLILGLVDYYTGIEISFSIFYLLPVSILAWYAGRSAGLASAILAGIVWLAADLAAGHTYSSNWIPVWNTLVRVSFFLIIAELLEGLKSNVRMRHENDLIIQKTEAFIQASQRITALIAENITEQNAQTLMWINRKRMRGESVCAKVENSSRIIAASLGVLSEFSFSRPYLERDRISSEEYLQDLSRRLLGIREGFGLERKTSIVERGLESDPPTAMSSNVCGSVAANWKKKLP